LEPGSIPNSVIRRLIVSLICWSSCCSVIFKLHGQKIDFWSNHQRLPQSRRLAKVNRFFQAAGKDQWPLLQSPKIAPKIADHDLASATKTRIWKIAKTLFTPQKQPDSSTKRRHV
jgi:hypothetical protein